MQLATKKMMHVELFKKCLELKKGMNEKLTLIEGKEL